MDSEEDQLRGHRSRYPSTSDEGYFFSGTVYNYEFCHQEFTISESFKEFRGYFRDWQSVYYV